MKIFHLFGCECSGKESIANTLKENLFKGNFLVWDILRDFYNPYGIITDTTTDWNKYRDNLDNLKNDLRVFIEENSNKHLIIISTGMNPNVNKILLKFRPIIPVPMIIPSDYTIRTLAKKRGSEPERVITFSRTWAKWVKNINIQKSYHFEDAYEFLTKEIGNENVQ
jgi:hypothetical protein